MTDTDTAVDIAQRVRRSLASTVAGVPITVSVGVAGEITTALPSPRASA